MDHLNEYKTFVLIPEEILDELIQAIRDLKKIQDVLKQEDHSGTLSDFVTEDKAKELLGRGTTWFWNKRKTGELSGKKAAGRWYYKSIDLKKFIENGRSL
jgi:hypothetical protein